MVRGENRIGFRESKNKSNELQLSFKTPTNTFRIELKPLITQCAACFLDSSARSKTAFSYVFIIELLDFRP
jgi:hypothetical protein